MFSMLALHICVCQWPIHCSPNSQTSFLNKIFIKNGSHGTVHTFKNYFAIVFSVFSNKRYPNRLLIGKISPKKGLKKSVATC